MALNERQTPLMATNNANYKTVKGITYFKLKSEYDWDYTKHSGLLGEEIDGNFYFLRGYDIESATIDENRNLIIQRVDKEYAPVVVNLGDKEANPTFEYDKVNGEITITFADGSVSKVGGFFVEGKDIRIATDNTFVGDGTMYNPLRLNRVERTGTYAPVDDFVDLSSKFNGFLSMPEGKGSGYRVVTKEKIDNFGCLYPFSAVERIQEKLDETQSQWRVPTKEDWDDLLNSAETEKYRNHGDADCKWLGKYAGVALKSYDLWDDDTNNVLGDSTKGQDVMGLSIYPLGIVPDRNALLGGDTDDAEGFGRLTGMWANTKSLDGNAYVKLFGYNEGRVDQDTYGEGSKMSIRLVKDYTYDNFNEIENILGIPYPTVLVHGPKKDYPYIKIWTKINFYSDAENLGGSRSEEWNTVSDSDRGVKVIYYINEWDGQEWIKKPMNEGDSVVINNYNDSVSYHEWRIINGELVDTAESLVSEFRKDFDEVKSDVSSLSAVTEDLINFSGKTEEVLNQLSAFTKYHTEIFDETFKHVEDEIHGVSGAVDTVSAITVICINEINAALNSTNRNVSNLSASTIENIDRFDSAIETIDDNISFVSGSVDTVSALTKAEITRLNNIINNEGTNRENHDITPGNYTLERDGMVLPTNGTEVDDVKIVIDDNFFNFGEF